MEVEFEIDKNFVKKCEVVTRAETYETTKDIVDSIRRVPTREESARYSKISFCTQKHTAAEHK